MPQHLHTPSTYGTILARESGSGPVAEWQTLRT